MVKPTPQREWIERRGILLWLAFFFIEVGAGAFLVSSFFMKSAEMLTGMIIGWLLCGVLGGGIHLAYLGHPMRFLRMLSRPSTSWVSRGLIFVIAFLVLGLVHMVLFRSGITITPLLAVVDVFAFLTIIYAGFAMNFVNGIPLWNTALLPVLYLVSGVWGGASIALGTALATGTTTALASTEEMIRILLIAYIVLLGVYLLGVRYSNVIGRFSVREIVQGRFSPVMWLVVVAIGLVLPSIVVVTSYAVGLENMPVSLLYLSIGCELVGDMAMRYLILRAGFYAPLISGGTTGSAA
jgi:formate-dependent nitrite reductase membrane component NrfD